MKYHTWRACLIFDICGGDNAEAHHLLTGRVLSTLIFTPTIRLFNRNQRPFEVGYASRARRGVTIGAPILPGVTMAFNREKSQGIVWACPG